MKNSAIFSKTVQENLRYKYDMLGVGNQWQRDWVLLSS